MVYYLVFKSARLIPVCAPGYGHPEIHGPGVGSFRVEREIALAKGDILEEVGHTHLVFTV